MQGRGRIEQLNENYKFRFSFYVHRYIRQENVCKSLKGLILNVSTKPNLE